MTSLLDLAGERRLVRNAVDMGCYEYATSENIVLIIDGSGSMDEGDRITIARDSAASFVDGLTATDMVGVVRFDNSAEIIHLLQMIQDETQKSAVKSAIQSIDAIGGTEIQDGLLLGQSQLDSRGVASSRQAMLLYTDETWYGAYESLGTTIAVKTLVHTCRPFSASDADFFTWLSQRRNGTYLSYPSSAGRLAIDGANGIMSEGQSEAEVSNNVHQIAVDETLIETTFRVSCADGSCTNVSLKTPSAVEINPGNASSFTNVTFHSYTGSVAYVVTNPEIGLWEMEVHDTQSVYEAYAYGKSHIGVDLLLDRLQYGSGEHVPLFVQTSPFATNVHAGLIKEQFGPTNSVTLYDDGNHGDGGSDDGLYGGSFSNAPAGSWRIIVSASGLTPDDSEFRRVTERSIYVVSNRAQLGTVTNVAASQAFTNEIEITWDAVPNAAYYDVYRNTSEERSGFSLMCVTNGISFTDTNIATDHTYFYRVKAFTGSPQKYLDGEFSELFTGTAVP